MAVNRARKFFAENSAFFTREDVEKYNLYNGLVALVEELHNEFQRLQSALGAIETRLQALQRDAK